MEEVNNYTRGVADRLKNDAPRTTPDSLEIFFGRSRHTSSINTLMESRVKQKGELKYPDFIEGLLVTYVRHVKDRRVSGYRELNSELVENLAWDKLGETKGSYSPSSGEIWIGFLPKNVSNRISSRLKNNGFELAGDFPFNYSKRNIHGIDYSENEFIEVAAHELTHSILTDQTSIGELQKEINSDQNLMALSGEDFVNYIMKMEHQQHLQDQAKAVSHNDDISAIEETFSHFISNYYLQLSNYSVASSYGRPEYIDWGIKLLEELSSLESPSYPVDWARMKALQVFEDIAQKGQLKAGSNESRDVFTLFLMSLLPEEEKVRLRKFHKINNDHLKRSYRDLKTVLNDLETHEYQSHHRDTFEELKKLEERVDWSYPEEIMDEVLHQSLEDGVGNYSLEQLHSRIENDLDKEINHTLQLIKLLRRLEKDLSGDIERRELEKVVKKFNTVEKELISIK